jgi:hypothetical protein
MLSGDPTLFLHLKQQDLLIEAERERLAAQLPHSRSSVRRDLALACYRLAGWLDDPKRPAPWSEAERGYLQQTDSGRVDWAQIR